MPTINKPARKKPNRRINTERRKEAHRLYASKEWHNLRLLKLQQSPMCERCGIKLAEEVHHKVSFMQFDDPEKRRQMALYVDLQGLMALCKECHSIIHKDNKTKKFI